MSSNLSGVASAASQRLAAFEVGRVHPQVRRWLDSESPRRGPLALAQPEAALAAVTPCRELAANGPDGPFPAVQLAEVVGVPLYLLLETGEILALHHDATLYEIAAAVAPAVRTPAELARALAAHGSVLSLDGLLALARAVASWPSLTPPDLTEPDRIRALCRGLGWTVRRLATNWRRKPLALEFLDLDGRTLADLATAEGKLARLAANPRARKLDLGNCRLSSLPEDLSGSPVEELDLSGNPELPWATLATELQRLPALRRLKVAGNGLGTAAELQAALPGIKLLVGRIGKAELLARTVRSGTTVRQVDLAGTGLARLPAEVDALVDLEVIDLSGNPRLDWNNVCVRLGRLPRLREVRLAHCDLLDPPPALACLKGIARLCLAGEGILAEDGNHFQAMGPKLELLRALPGLRQVDLGDFPPAEYPPGRRPPPPPDALDLPALTGLEEIALSVGAYNTGYLEALLAWMRRLPALRSLRIHADRGSLSRLGLLKHLEELEVTGRAAQTLRPALGLLPRLRRLSVHWDQLRRTGEPQEIVPLPTTIRAMKQLRRLDLTWYPADAGAGLQCGELPEWLAELPLAELQLWAPGQGGLRRLPAAVYRLVGLRRLVVALATDEHGLEPAIARLGALEHLVLRTSGYGRLPADIRLPTALTLLETSFMPANLSELSRLRTLRLHRLPLGKDDVAAIARLPALEQLDARCAPGVSLPPALAGHAGSKRGRRC